MLLEAPAVGYIAAHTNIEFFDADDRYLGSSSLTPVTETDTWVEGEAEFTVPEFTAECRLMFYLNAGVTGAARFAAPTIGPASFYWTAYPLTPVRDELPASGGKVPFGFFSLGQPEAPVVGDWSCRVELEAQGTVLFTTEAAIRNGRFAVTVDPLPAGPATLTLTLLDGQGNRYDARTMAVQVVDEAKRGIPACVIDKHGRALRNGRPYLPLGLYMGMVERDEIAEIAESPFNCLMPYGSMFLKFQESALEGVAGIREVLDACHARDISIIFSMAGLYGDSQRTPGEFLGEATADGAAAVAVRAFRDHPAVLAWYVNDEQPVECIPRLVARRQLVRSLDPGHPIYAVMCQAPELPLYTPIVDVYGIDPYPIVHPTCNHIRASRYTHDMAEKAVLTDDGMALWTVVQAHNIGAYDHKAMQDPAFYREEYRDPSFDEILALALLAVLRGAKGLLFYSYPDLAHPTFDAGSRGRRWDNLRRAGQAVRDIESYLLADAEAPTLALHVIEGEVEARAFRDDQGRDCVVVVGIGPGASKAEITLPAGMGMVSKFARTVALGNGRYRFEGVDVCSDVLVRG